MRKRYPTITLRIPENMLDTLKEIARQTGHTLGYLIREAISAYLGSEKEHPDV